VVPLHRAGYVDSFKVYLETGKRPVNLSACSNSPRSGDRIPSRQTLEERGHLVNVFDNGESTLTAWASRTPDVAVIETDLPDMSGAELTRRLLEAHNRPVVVLSKEHQRSVVLEAIDAGVSNYLVKPVTAVQLETQLDVAIAHHVTALRKEPSQSHLQPVNTGIPSASTRFDALLDKFAFGVIVLNDDQRVVIRNIAAEQLLYPVDVVNFVGSHLRTANPEQSRKLDAFIDKLVSPNWAKDRADAITLHNIDNDYHIQIWGIRLDDVKQRDEQGGTPCVTLLISAPGLDIPVPTHLLKSMYDLTPAEALMSKALMNGLSLDQYTIQQKVSRNTAKTHLRSIFEKMRITRQVDLIRTLSKLIPAIRH